LGIGHSSFKLVTYVSRGFESMRGFDVFMKLAKRLCDRRSDVIFLVAGQDRCCYSGDERVTGKRSFKEWVLSQDDYDLSRIRFVGLLPPKELARLLARSDLHVYLTAPFVLSWSLLNALACGATVLASDTPPVREVICHEQNGLLADFFDVDGLVELADRVLDAPNDYRPLGQAGVRLIQEKYSLAACLPRLVRLYEETAAGQGGSAGASPSLSPRIPEVGVYGRGSTRGLSPVTQASSARRASAAVW